MTPSLQVGFKHSTAIIKDSRFNVSLVLRQLCEHAFH